MQSYQHSKGSHLQDNSAQKLQGSQKKEKQEVYGFDLAKEFVQSKRKKHVVASQKHAQYNSQQSYQPDQRQLLQELQYNKNPNSGLQQQQMINGASNAPESNHFARFSQHKAQMDSKRQRSNVGFSSMGGNQNIQIQPSHGQFSVSPSRFKLDDAFHVADNLIKEDQMRGKDQIEQKLNSLVNKYEQPPVYADSKRYKYKPTAYRGQQLENNNNIINNNTNLRLFERNNPIRNEIQPILDQNIAGNKPRRKMINYVEDNLGILRRNKSQHLRNLYTIQQLERESSEQRAVTQSLTGFNPDSQNYQSMNNLQMGQSTLPISQSQQQLFMPPQAQVTQLIPEKTLEDKFKSIGEYYQFKDHQRSALRHIGSEQTSPHIRSNTFQNSINNNHLTDRAIFKNLQMLQQQTPQSQNFYNGFGSSSKLQNSQQLGTYNIISGQSNSDILSHQKKEFQRMVENQKRSQLLAEDFITKPTINKDNDLPIDKLQSGDWKSSKFRQISLLDQIPQNIIDRNKYFQLEQVYKTTKANERSSLKDSGPLDPKNILQSSMSYHNLHLGNNSSKSLMSQAKYLPQIQERYQNYPRLAKSGLLEQFHPALSNKPHFRDLIDFSRTLDRDIAQTMRTKKELY